MGHPAGEKSTLTRRQSSGPPADHFDWRSFAVAMLPEGINSPFAVEMLTFRDRLDDMLAEHEGEYVVIKSDRIISYHRNRPAAVKAVFEAFGREPALVKQAAEFEPIRRLGGTLG